MQLFYSPTSPFARKVLVLAHETGQIESIEIVQCNPWEEGATTKTPNPLGKIPLLLLDDDQPLADSTHICRYLLSRASNSQMLLPPAKTYTQLHLEALGDGISEATAMRFLELNRRPPEKQMDYWLERHQGAITRSLQWLESNSSQFTQSFALGAIAVAVALGYLDFRYSELNWRDACPSIANWYKGVAKRQSMVATMPPK